ncbi:hypothetical protein ACF0H5_006658 [Mactra antiquata]
MSGKMEYVTCTAPVNIAVIKYWGKRDEKLVLPMNSSVSVTLSQDQLRAKTTIAACKTFSNDKIWLNGREESFDNPRIQNLLHEVKCRARIQNGSDLDQLLSWKIHICSENNFPTAAGLASSAAGYACLAFTLAQLYKVTGDVSDIARRGSGSACRSVYGGFVVWNKGENIDGTDSIARQILPHTHWSDLHILILVVSDQKKHTGSSEGMQKTVQTSELYKQRVKCVPERTDDIIDAIKNKDFDKFAEITMKDSNQLHAVCLDTYPPISYLTDTSRDIMTLVHRYNTFKAQNKVAYTFDAGPNACLYLNEADVPGVISIIEYFFPPTSQSQHFITGLPINTRAIEKEFISNVTIPIQPDGLKYVIHTTVGDGPRVCTNEDSLLDRSGEPISPIAEKRNIDSVL